MGRPARFYEQMRTARLTAYLATGIVAFLAACSDANGPAGDLRLDIALDRSLVSLTDSVQVTLTLRNVSPKTISVIAADAYGLCNHAFEAFDPVGRNVTPPTAFCIAVATILAPTSVPLGPGEHITIREWWNVSRSNVNGAPLIPGTYHVRGLVGTAEGQLRSSERLVELVP